MASPTAASLREALVVAVVFAMPVALAPFPPGQDLPMHAVAVAGLDYAGYLEPAPLTSSYLTLYALVAPLGWLVEAPRAVGLVAALYVLAFAIAARRLLLAFGAHPGVSLLALPAAFSVVWAYGFLPFALGYPLIFWQWAAARELAERSRSRWTWLALAATSIGLGLTHPLAAALGAGGAGVILLVYIERARLRAFAGMAGLIGVGLAPSLIALAQIGARGPGVTLPPLMRDASLWERFWLEPRLPIGDAVGAATGWLLGGFAASHRGPLMIGLLVVLAAVLAAGGQAARRGASRRARFAPELLLAALVTVYLITPWQLDEPFVIALQPRVLPLIWVVGLCALRPAPAPTRPRAVELSIATGVAIVLVAWLAAIAPVLAEGRDLDRVVARAAPGALTLALVEQAPAPEHAPAGIWRHAGTHLMALRGGFASHAFFDRGSWLPLRRAADAAPPPAPPPGWPRELDCREHLGGWQQVLIRDLDPTARHDYAAGCPQRLESVAAHGRWRLYRVR